MGSRDEGGGGGGGGGNSSISSTIMMVTMIAVCQCSETYGIGVQRRRAYCVKEPVAGHRVEDEGGGGGDGGGNNSISSTIMISP